MKYLCKICEKEFSEDEVKQMQPVGHSIYGYQCYQTSRYGVIHDLKETNQKEKGDGIN